MHGLGQMLRGLRAHHGNLSIKDEAWHAGHADFVGACHLGTCLPFRLVGDKPLEYHIAVHPRIGGNVRQDVQIADMLAVQKEAAEHILHGSGRISTIIGDAGTGKTTLLKPVAETLKESNPYNPTC